MLDHARRKETYTDLIRSELTEFLCCPACRPSTSSSRPRPLVYFGDLAPFLKAAAGALRPSGLLVFTVEHAGAQDGTDFRLELHGRYSHSEGYVRGALEAQG